MIFRIKKNNGKGRHKWCPGSVIDEIEDIKKEEGLHRDADALNKMVKYSQVGREAKRLITFDFRFKPRKINKKRGKR